MTRMTAERLAEVFVEVADTLTDEFDLIEFLQSVATHSSELVDARAAGILLSDGEGHLQLMAASDERTEMLELFQVQAHEGPCQDSFRLGRPVVNADLSTASERWPRFAPAAVAAGFRSVHAFPLRLRAQVIGALNMFGTSPGEIAVEDARMVQALADIATIGLLQERSLQQAELLSDQLQGALRSRVTIEQAKGALAQIHGCTPDEAFQRLRTYCRRNNLKLSVVAHSVVHDRRSVPQLMQPGS